MSSWTSVSLCVLVIEVAEESPLIPSLFYLAPKYMASGEGTVEKLVFGPGEPGKSRGHRQPHPMSVEKFSFDEDTSGKEKEGQQGRGGGETDASDTDSTTAEREREPTKKVHFQSGNPFVEVTKGILHLYKENERTSLGGSDTARSEMLLMLAVPASVSCRDLLQFVAPFQRDIEHVTIVRDSAPNQYMVLIKLKGQKEADMFYQTLNGTNFNSFEEDVCNLAYVARVETVKETDSVGCIPGHTELPTCPVCLERMDESVDGVLTILCNHSFHSICLSKWSDARCPVCRFSQTPEMTVANQCFECGSSESLWICLICGHIGCGRYVHGHAYQHFCETTHCYAIQPDNNRVWDYVGDNFVHRLLQNKDGKMVEVGGRRQPTADESCEETEEKLDSMQLEFTYMLTTQLESQRFYFEEMLAVQAREMSRNLEKLKNQVDEGEKRQKDTERQVSDLVKERGALERKVTQLQQKLNKVTAELRDEKEMNKCLKGDHEKWKSMVTTLEKDRENYITEKTKEIAELKDEIRDLMFFIEGQRTIADSDIKDELVEGQVTVGPAAASGSKKDKRKKR